MVLPDTCVGLSVTASGEDGVPVPGTLMHAYDGVYMYRRTYTMEGTRDEPVDFTDADAPFDVYEWPSEWTLLSFESPMGLGNINKPGTYRLTKDGDVFFVRYPEDLWPVQTTHKQVTKNGPVLAKLQDMLPGYSYKVEGTDLFFKYPRDCVLPGPSVHTADGVALVAGMHVPLPIRNADNAQIDMVIEGVRDRVVGENVAFGGKVLVAGEEPRDVQVALIRVRGADAGVCGLGTPLYELWSVPDGQAILESPADPRSSPTSFALNAEGTGADVLVTTVVSARQQSGSMPVGIQIDEEEPSQRSITSVDTAIGTFTIVAAAGQIQYIAPGSSQAEVLPLPDDVLTFTKSYQGVSTFYQYAFHDGPVCACSTGDGHVLVFLGGPSGSAEPCWYCVVYQVMDGDLVPSQLARYASTGHPFWAHVVDDVLVPAGSRMSPAIRIQVPQPLRSGAAGLGTASACAVPWVREQQTAVVLSWLAEGDAGVVWYQQMFWDHQMHTLKVFELPEARSVRLGSPLARLGCGNVKVASLSVDSEIDGAPYREHLLVLAAVQSSGLGCDVLATGFGQHGVELFAAAGVAPVSHTIPAQAPLTVAGMATGEHGYVTAHHVLAPAAADEAMFSSRWQPAVSVDGHVTVMCTSATESTDAARLVEIGVRPEAQRATWFAGQGEQWWLTADDPLFAGAWSPAYDEAARELRLVTQDGAVLEAYPMRNEDTDIETVSQRLRLMSTRCSLHIQDVAADGGMLAEPALTAALGAGEAGRVPDTVTPPVLFMGTDEDAGGVVEGTGVGTSADRPAGISEAAHAAILACAWSWTGPAPAGSDAWPVAVERPAGSGGVVLRIGTGRVWRLRGVSTLQHLVDRVTTTYLRLSVPVAADALGVVDAAAVLEGALAALHGSRVRALVPHSVDVVRTVCTSVLRTLGGWQTPEQARALSKVQILTGRLSVGLSVFTGHGVVWNSEAGITLWRHRASVRASQLHHDARIKFESHTGTMKVLTLEMPSFTARWPWAPDETLGGQHAALLESATPTQTDFTNWASVQLDRVRHDSPAADAGILLARYARVHIRALWRNISAPGFVKFEVLVRQDGTSSVYTSETRVVGTLALCEYTMMVPSEWADDKAVSVHVYIYDSNATFLAADMYTARPDKPLQALVPRPRWHTANISAVPTRAFQIKYAGSASDRLLSGLRFQAQNATIDVDAAISFSLTRPDGPLWEHPMWDDAASSERLVCVVYSQTSAGDWVDAVRITLGRGYYHRYGGSRTSGTPGDSDALTHALRVHVCVPRDGDDGEPDLRETVDIPLQVPGLSPETAAGILALPGHGRYHAAAFSDDGHTLQGSVHVALHTDPCEKFTVRWAFGDQEPVGSFTSPLTPAVGGSWVTGAARRAQASLVCVAGYDRRVAPVLPAFKDPKLAREGLDAHRWVEPIAHDGTLQINAVALRKTDTARGWDDRVREDAILVSRVVAADDMAAFGVLSEDTPLGDYDTVLVPSALRTTGAVENQVLRATSSDRPSNQTQVMAPADMSGFLQSVPSRWHQSPYHCCLVLDGDVHFAHHTSAGARPIPATVGSDSAWFSVGDDEHHLDDDAHEEGGTEPLLVSRLVVHGDALPQDRLQHMLQDYDSAAYAYDCYGFTDIDYGSLTQPVWQSAQGRGPTLDRTRPDVSALYPHGRSFHHTQRLDVLRNPPAWSPVASAPSRATVVAPETEDDPWRRAVVSGLFSLVPDGDSLSIVEVDPVFVGFAHKQFVTQRLSQPRLKAYLEGPPPVPAENLVFRDSTDRLYAVQTSYTRTTTMTRDRSWRDYKIGPGTTTSISGLYGFKSFIFGGALFGPVYQYSSSKRSLVRGGDTSRTKTRTVNLMCLLSGTHELVDINRSEGVDRPALPRRFVPRNHGVVLASARVVNQWRIVYRGRVLAQYEDEPDDEDATIDVVIPFPLDPRRSIVGCLDGVLGVGALDTGRVWVHPWARSYLTQSAYNRGVKASYASATPPHMRTGQGRRPDDYKQTRFVAVQFGEASGGTSSATFTHSNPIQDAHTTEINRKGLAAEKESPYSKISGGYERENGEETSRTRNHALNDSSTVVNDISSYYTFTHPGRVVLSMDPDVLVNEDLSDGASVDLVPESPFYKALAPHDMATVDAYRHKLNSHVRAYRSMEGYYLGWYNPSTGSDELLPRPGAVGSYQFDTFVIHDSEQANSDFFDHVADKVWLSTDPLGKQMAANRTASATGVDRVCHVVNYVERVPPLPQPAAADESGAAPTGAAPVRDVTIETLYCAGRLPSTSEGVRQSVRALGCDVVSFGSLHPLLHPPRNLGALLATMQTFDTVVGAVVQSGAVLAAVVAHDGVAPEPRDVHGAMATDGPAGDPMLFLVEQYTRTWDSKRSRLRDIMLFDAAHPTTGTLAATSDHLIRSATAAAWVDEQPATWRGRVAQSTTAVETGTLASVSGAPSLSIVVMLHFYQLQQAALTAYIRHQALLVSTATSDDPVPTPGVPIVAERAPDVAELYSSASSITLYVTPVEDLVNQCWYGVRPYQPGTAGQGPQDFNAWVTTGHVPSTQTGRTSTAAVNLQALTQHPSNIFELMLYQGDRERIYPQAADPPLLFRAGRPNQPAADAWFTREDGLPFVDRLTVVRRTSTQSIVTASSAATVPHGVTSSHFLDGTVDSVMDEEVPPAVLNGTLQTLAGSY